MRGEPLVQKEEDQESMSLKISATQSSPSILASATTMKTIPPPSKNVSAQNRGQKQSKSRVPPPKSKLTSSVLPSGSLQDDASADVHIDSKLVACRISSESVTDEVDTADKPVVKSHPKKGQATKVCGCYGTFHKPLTNCLYCGRISCVEEGYDYCPFCGFMVEDIRDNKEYVHVRVQICKVFVRVRQQLISSLSFLSNY